MFRRLRGLDGSPQSNVLSILPCEAVPTLFSDPVNVSLSSHTQTMSSCSYLYSWHQQPQTLYNETYPVFLFLRSRCPNHGKRPRLTTLATPSIPKRSTLDLLSRNLMTTSLVCWLKILWSMNASRKQKYCRSRKECSTTLSRSSQLRSYWCSGMTACATFASNCHTALSLNQARRWSHKDNKEICQPATCGQCLQQTHGRS